MHTQTATPVLGPISRQVGLAGHVTYSAEVTYPGEEPRRVTFHGSVYGGPVTMVTGGQQLHVADPGRFGEFGPDWVRAFFA